MTPRERVIKTLQGECFQPIPAVTFIPSEVVEARPGDCAELLRRFPNDLDVVHHRRFLGAGDEFADTWGTMWKLKYGHLHAMTPPPCQEFCELLELPQIYVTIPQEEFDSVSAYCEDNPRFVVMQIPMQILGQTGALLGTEKLLQGLRKKQANMITFMDRLHQTILHYLDSWCKMEVDAICLTNNWLAREGMLIPPGRWEEIVMPYFRQYIQKIHAADKYAFFSGSGDIQDLLPPLVDAGIDVIRYDVTEMDSTLLARRFRGRVAFHPVFPVHRFDDKTTEEISEEILNLRRIFENSNPILAECSFREDTPYEHIVTAVANWRRRMPEERTY